MDELKDKTVKFRVSSNMMKKLVKVAKGKHPHGNLSTFMREVVRVLIRKI